MTDYDTTYAMLSKTLKLMGNHGYDPKLTKEQNIHEDILILGENGNETWYYFDKKTHALSAIRVYGK